MINNVDAVNSRKTGFFHLTILQADMSQIVAREEGVTHCCKVWDEPSV
jgi:hypothetical protein